MAETSTDDLVNFWLRCDLTRPPYAHPDDWQVLREGNGQYIDEEPKDFEKFVSSDRFGKFDDKRFHLSLLPSPYCGDLHTADIFILLLNPGFGFTDYYGEMRVPQFRRRLEQMLAQSFDGVDFPFVFLDPEYCWHGGFFWWEKKLRDVTTVIANKKFNGNYLDALRSLSKRLGSLEMVPYHSSSFDAHRIIQRLPSAQAARRFAHKLLSDTEGNIDRTVIVTRQVSAWGLSGNPRNLICYEGGHTRGASLGRESGGGRAILKRYGIEAPDPLPRNG